MAVNPRAYAASQQPILLSATTLPRIRLDKVLDWRSEAVCSKDENTSLFFPVGVTGAAAVQIEKAKAVCADCPVRVQCLEYAITTNQEYGIWGGTNEEERRVLRREWRREQRAKKARLAAERKAQRDLERERECQAS